MCKYLSNAGRQPILLGLIVTLMMSIGFRSSCSNHKGIGLPANNSQRLNSNPKEVPIPLQRTKDNKGKRCEARYYFGARFKGLDKGEGYSAFCYELQSKLVQAAREGNLADIRETLKYGANLNLPVDNSFPSLLVAASSGQTDAVRLLLDNGAEVNHVADFQNTPLNLAASDGHIETVRVLLERGADPCYPEKGRTAGDIARARGFKELADMLKSVETQKCS